MVILSGAGQTVQPGPGYMVCHIQTSGEIDREPDGVLQIESRIAMRTAIAIDGLKYIRVASPLIHAF